MQIIPQRHERSMISGRFLSGGRSVSILHLLKSPLLHTANNPSMSECCVQKHKDQYTLIFHILHHNVLADNRLSCYSFYGYRFNVFLLHVRVLHLIINTSHHKGGQGGSATLRSDAKVSLRPGLCDMNDTICSVCCLRRAPQVSSFDNQRSIYKTIFFCAYKNRPKQLSWQTRFISTGNITLQEQQIQHA